MGRRVGAGEVGEGEGSRGGGGGGARDGGSARGGSRGEFFFRAREARASSDFLFASHSCLWLNFVGYIS